jgi:succinoglycan biosynthesis protein ExoA
MANTSDCQSGRRGDALTPLESSLVLAERPLRVLVVVPSLNEAQHITSVLNALLQDNSASNHVTIVAADGGSVDGTQQLVQSLAAEHPSVELLHNPKRIQSAAVNLAVQRFGLDADILIRCDAHASYPKDYCSRLIQTLLRTGAHAVVVPLDSLGSSPVQRAVAWASNSLLGTGGAAHRAGRKSGFVDHGHHAAFRMSMFRDAGGYDETFTHNEDAEFDCRQRALGAQIFLDSEIRVGYRPRSSFRALWKQYFQYGGGRSRTVRRHPSSLRLRQLAVPSHLVLSAAAFAVCPWQPAALAWPALYVGISLTVALQLAVRHRSACGLLVAPVAFVMHTAWGLGFFAGLVSKRERPWSRDMTSPLWLPTTSGDAS